MTAEDRMFTLDCKDMGSMDCSFQATDETMDGVLAKMKEHATTAHPEKMAEMAGKMSEEEMMEMMKKAAKTV